ncbi:ArsR/SmtB family transcription factor [Streptomyces sp. NPDC006259]|uniref:ArsR/SmtB family transcription factor n=1 Tax=Streptomyces sp. NPDC006259 TaxID=3364740 RepID=UPI0036B2ABBB
MPGTYLSLGPLDDVHVEVVRGPGPTLFPLLHDVLGDGAHHGVPGPWRRAVAAALPSAAELVGPLFAAGSHWAPDTLALTADLRAASIGAVLARLDDADPRELGLEVAHHFQGRPPRSWQRLVSDPSGTLRAYRDVVTAASRVMQPLWNAADPLLGKEVERIGAAVVSRNLDAVLTGLDPGYRYEQGCLRLPHGDGHARIELGGRRLVLIPVASGSKAAMYSLDSEQEVWLGYPLPGQGRLTTRQQPPRKDALSQLLGPLRAGVLRSVQPPATVSELAALLNVGVSTITYHCEHLKAAGLLQRERHGREVRQRLTRRGAELVELLAGPIR